MDYRFLVPLLTPFTRYSEWKLKMILSLKRQYLYEVSIGFGKESYEDENDQINGDRYFGTICLSFSPSFHYLIDYVEYPKDLWTKLDRTFGKHNEDHYSNLENTPSTTRVLYSKFSSSTLFDEVVQDEEAKYSTQSIQIEESLLGVTPSLLLQNFMRSLISHLLIWLIQKNTFEYLLLNKKISFHSMQTFSSDSSILNYVHSLPAIASEN